MPQFETLPPVDAVPSYEAPPSAQPAPASTGTWRLGPRVAAVPAAAQPHADQPAVYRCTLRGRVTYSDGADCHGGHGARLDLVEADLPPMPHVTQGVPAAAHLDAASRERHDRPLSAAAQTMQHWPEQGSDEANRRARCASLDAVVRSLDAQARLPQSGPMQDELRRGRGNARSEQFALHC